MSCTTSFRQNFVFFPFGNTPAVSLTQDLPPEKDADILLLGCGGVRNILFTCFADAARKIDVTCCDIEPLIHARNVLLYTLLLEDPTNLNIERIWNIYYHWKLDKGSLKLLETQTQKLIKFSESVDQWHGSVYGSHIRFCDERSLSCIRTYWKGFQSQGLNDTEKAVRLKQLQAAMDRAKVWRKANFAVDDIFLGDLRSGSPIGYEVIDDISKVANYWWNYGTLPSSRPSTPMASDLNPALLYSPNAALTMSSGLDPLLGFPICTAFTPIAKGSAFHLDRKGTTAEYLVNCAMIHFKQWASAFRRAIANKSVVRIFCGDALDFSLALRNFQLTGGRSIHLPSDNDILELNRSDYGHDESTAPVSFDIIDTSNLIDFLGPLNVVPIVSTLLKYHSCSCLYTELLVLQDLNLRDRMNDFFGVDVRSMALLLGLVPPELFTNATDSFEEDPIHLGLMGEKNSQGIARSRLRWRRLRGCHESLNFSGIQVETKELSKFLIQVYNAMFRHEDIGALSQMLRSRSTSVLMLIRRSKVFYNRASFASLLSHLKAFIVSDWDQCVTNLYNNIFSADPLKSVTLNYTQDLLLNMHIYGVDNGRFQKPAPADVTNSILDLTLPISENVPDQLCITIQVPREELKIFAEVKAHEMGVTCLSCSFNDGDFLDDLSMSCIQTFSTIRMVFGSRQEQMKDGYLHLYIKEDSSELSGTSDMFLSFMVPTKMLLKSKQSIPSVQCELIPTTPVVKNFTSKFGPFLCFKRYKITSKNVFITRYMPGMSRLPVVAPAHTCRNEQTLVATTVRFTQDGSQIKTLTQRVNLESQATKATLALPSSKVDIKFKSPWTAFVTIAQSEELKLEFPVPVSSSKYTLRIARKSSYIEVETPLFDPLEKDAASFSFPAFITEVPGASVPTLWTSTRIDLDVMPAMDLENKLAVSWLVSHAYLMFSNREGCIRKSNMTNCLISDAIADVRTDVKDGIFSILMHYAGLKCQQAEFFALTKMDGFIQTLIFPSCLRLDLVNHTVVLDAAMIPLTKTVLSDPRAARFIQELTNNDLCQVKVSEVEYYAWKALMPALVERCRTATTWSHAPGCEYVQTGEVPLPQGLTEDTESPICSCGIGKFPSGDYLRSQMKRLPELSYMVSQHATRTAIAPIFAVPYLEECTIDGLLDNVCFDPHVFEKLSAEIKCYGINRAVYNKEKCVIKEKCVKCGKSESGNIEAPKHSLKLCSKCQLVRYCSAECQKADWKEHKPFCSKV